MPDNADNRGRDEHDRFEAPARLEREATEWFFRRDGGFSAEDENAFNRWLRADERHGAAFAQIERTWRAFGGARDRVVGPGAFAEITTSSPRRRSWRAAVLAAAAAVAVGFFGWQMSRHFEPRPAAGPGAGLAFAEHAATEGGGLRKMELPDGSSLTLNGDSAVDVQFTVADRRVRLRRGEVHFNVAKNPRRPFVVEANGVAVSAVGTAFNVRLHAEAVEVLVTEGKVRVDDAARGQSLLAAADPASTLETEVVMNSGEKAVIAVKADAAPAAATLAVLSLQEIEAALAWQKRSLDYTDAPLAEIVADFNRFNQHRLVIADAALAGRRFGGTFPAGDYRALVRVLEETFGVVVERRERETILRAR